MTNGQAVGIGLSIVAGLVVHALLTREPSLRSADASLPSGATAEWMTPSERDRVREQAESLERVRTRSEEMKTILAERKSSTLTLGDRTLLVFTEWHEKSGDFALTTSFYEWREGKLVRVPLSDEPAPSEVNSTESGDFYSTAAVE